MNQSPILKALSILFTSKIRALLMGGQACILYGAAEFSRDIDLAILVSAENLNELQNVLADLQAETVYVPEMNREVLLKGHACHFRCQAPDVSGLRIDVMGRMRGVDDFAALWERRVEIDLPGVGRVSLMALPDLIRAKKTQRDKDWPMIRQLIEADYHRQGLNASEDRLMFWLMECRTPEILHVLVDRYPHLARRAAQHRPLLNPALAGNGQEVMRLLRDEEDREREKDRQYWAPLRRELELWRREQR